MRGSTSCSTLNVLTKNSMAQTWHQGVSTSLWKWKLNLRYNERNSKTQAELNPVRTNGVKFYRVWFLLVFLIQKKKPPLTFSFRLKFICLEILLRIHVLLSTMLQLCRFMLDVVQDRRVLHMLNYRLPVWAIAINAYWTCTTLYWKCTILVLCCRYQDHPHFVDKKS